MRDHLDERYVRYIPNFFNGMNFTQTEKIVLNSFFFFFFGERKNSAKLDES